MNHLENILLKASSLRKRALSFLYSQMFYKTPNISSKTCWAEDFGCQLDSKVWRKIFLNAKKITCSNKTHETQYKIIHRLHVTPVIRSKYDPTCSAQCLKCKASAGTYSHMIWSCPKIAFF